MRAWRVHEYGDPRNVMRLDDVEPPEARPGQVLIEVEAAGLNFADTLIIAGQYQERPPLPYTPGLEVAGLVVGAGAGADHLLGRRVVAGPLVPQGGGLAELMVCDADRVFGIPDSLDSAAAAALHMNYQTGWIALRHRAHIEADDVLLVHAGAGGVGSAAIQLGLAAGARVIATAGGPEKVAVCRRLGAHVVVDYTTEDFVAAVKEATDGRGADIVYDPVGGDVFDRSTKCIAFEGRILVVGFTSGRIPSLPVNHALVKNYSVVGVHAGLYRTVRPDMWPHVHHELMVLHEQGLIDPLVHSEMRLEDALDGLLRIADRGTWGKVIVRPSTR